MNKKILILGSGMYVTGRGTDGYGTILPVLTEYQSQGKIEDIYIISNSIKGMLEAKDKVKDLDEFMQLESNISFLSLEETTLEQIIKDHGLKDSLAIVSTPDHTHYEYIKQLLSFKLNVQVVKPFVLELDHAIELAEIAKENKLTCSVEFHKRYDEANQMLKSQIDNDEIGNILYSVVEYSQRKIIPEKVFKGWCENSSILQYLGVHYCDLIYYITGAVPQRVSCTGQKSYLSAKNINVHDAIQVNIEWAIGAEKFNSFIITNWVDSNKSSSMSDQKIKFVGTKGRAESDQKHRGLQIVNENGVEDINPYFSRFYHLEHGPRLRGYGPKSIQSFLDNVLSSEQADKLTSFKDAIFSTAILQASMSSLEENGNWVDIDNKKISQAFPELYSK